MTKSVAILAAAMWCVALAFVPFAFSQQSGKSPDGIWQRIDSGGPELLSTYGDQTQPHSVLVLNPHSLDDFLRAAPGEFSEQAKGKAIVISLPFPNGTFQKFRIEESPIMETPLGSKGFQSRTFKGTGIDDPTATARFEAAFDGFHGVVRTGSGVFYVDPTARKSGAESYFSYFAPSKSPSNNELHCVVGEEQTKRYQQRRSLPRSPSYKRDGTHLKEYRLALAANSFYVAAVYDSHLSASKFDQAAAAIVRTINRVNAVFEVELGVRLTLVKNEAKLIFVDKDKDPYRDVNADGDKALALNQKTIDKTIGSNNYDIGHLFTTRTSGLARLQATCSAETKAMGVTGLAEPTGDAFDVDYVAHEIGHQFGANHTFNGTSGSCRNNRNSSTAYEPGSGSTIMAYAGICDPESVQTHSDAYFHLASLLEINDFIGTGSSGDSCGLTRTISSGGTPQLVVHHDDYVIPKGTPFVLAANVPQASPGTTYTWEEFDLGDASPPNDENGPNTTARPLFRSVLPGPSPARYFPDFKSLFQAAPPIGEALPMRDRPLTFQITGRDNHGGFAVAQQRVRIYASSGPFKVLPISEGRIWELGSTHEIRWDVAGTQQDPINCDRLRVSLVIDGQPDSRVLLNDKVPNTGAVTLAIPDKTPVTTHGRVMLESYDNIFFALSPYEIEIVRR